MVGDLVGFVAATYMRGVPFVQVIRVRVRVRVGVGVGVRVGVADGFRARVRVRVGVSAVGPPPARPTRGRST